MMIQSAKFLPKLFTDGRLMSRAYRLRGVTASWVPGMPPEARY